MMKAFLILAAIILVAGLFATQKVVAPGPSAAVRYRLTLEAEVDGRPVSGSGVIETRYGSQVRISPEAGRLTESVRGEAVALDLGERGVLFAVLKAGKDANYRPEALPLYAFGRRITLKGAPGFNAASSLSGRAEVPLDKLWMLVRFRDVNDPKTVEAVDPNDLEKSFGPGVKLIRATIEMTSDPVTTGIEKRLTWLSKFPEPSLSPVSDPLRDPLHPPLAATIHHGDFRRN